MRTIFEICLDNAILYIRIGRGAVSRSAIISHKSDKIHAAADFTRAGRLIGIEIRSSGWISVEQLVANANLISKRYGIRIQAKK